MIHSIDNINTASPDFRLHFFGAYLEKDKNGQIANIDEHTDKKKHILINSNEILYITTGNNFIHNNFLIILANQYNHCFICRGTMNQLAVVLLPKGYLRIHNAFIANSNHIVSRSGEILTVGNVELPIGPHYLDAVKLFFNN